MPKVYPLILSGGSGSRLWPLSREEYPKQLLPLLNPTSMLQDTILRLEGLDELAVDGPSNTDYIFSNRDQLCGGIASDISLGIKNFVNGVNEFRCGLDVAQ